MVGVYCLSDNKSINGKKEVVKIYVYYSAHPSN